MTARVEVVSALPTTTSYTIVTLSSGFWNHIPTNYKLSNEKHRLQPFPTFPMKAAAPTLLLSDDLWICILYQADLPLPHSLHSNIYHFQNPATQTRTAHTSLLLVMRQLLIDPHFLSHLIQFPNAEPNCQTLRETSHVDLTVTEDSLYGWVPSTTLISIPCDYGITDGSSWAAKLNQSSRKGRGKFRFEVKRYGFTALHYALLTGRV